MVYLSKEQRRAEIITAAMRVMENEGLAAATVRNVAKSIAASPGQIHHHFDSADAMRAEAFLNLWTKLGDAYLSRVATDSPLETIVALMGGDCTLPEKQSFKRLYHDLLEASRMSDTMQNVLFKIMRLTDEKFELLLIDAKTKGEIPKDVDTGHLTITLKAISFGVGFMNDINPDKLDIKQIVLDQIDLVNRAYGHTPGT